MKLPILLCVINSPSIIVLNDCSNSVLAPVNITFIFVLIKYILPDTSIYNKFLSPSALSVTQYEYGLVIFGTIISELFGTILILCNATELGPIKLLVYTFFCSYCSPFSLYSFSNNNLL